MFSQTPHTQVAPPGARSGRTVLLAAVGIAAVCALVWWLGKPWNREQCVAEAARMPTDAGVRAAMQMCFRKFGPFKS